MTRSCTNVSARADAAIASMARASDVGNAATNIRNGPAIGVTRVSALGSASSSGLHVTRGSPTAVATNSCTTRRWRVSALDSDRDLGVSTHQNRTRW